MAMVRVDAPFLWDGKLKVNVDAGFDADIYSRSVGGVARDTHGEALFCKFGRFCHRDCGGEAEFLCMLAGPSMDLNLYISSD